MDGLTKQWMSKALQSAHQGAFRYVQPLLEAFPIAKQQAIQDVLAAFHACVLQHHEHLLSAEEAGERLAALIFGHPEPAIVKIVQQYAESFSYLLGESKERLENHARHQDN